MARNNINIISPLYSARGTIGKDDFTAKVVLDKRNNSVHIHFYSNFFGNGNKPILVKHSNKKFPETINIDLVKEIILGEIEAKHVHIEHIAEEKEMALEDNKPSHRTIIRFEK